MARLVCICANGADYGSPTASRLRQRSSALHLIVRVSLYTNKKVQNPLMRILDFWSKWRDSNSRHPAPKAGALPTALHLDKLPLLILLLIGISALPVAVPGSFLGVKHLRHLPTAATRSAPFSRHRRWSHCSPTALHLVFSVTLLLYTIAREKATGIYPPSLSKNDSHRALAAPAFLYENAPNDGSVLQLMFPQFPWRMIPWFQYYLQQTEFLRWCLCLFRYFLPAHLLQAL